MSKCQSCGAGLPPAAIQCQYCSTAVPGARPPEPEMNMDDLAARMGQARQLLDQMMDQTTPAPLRFMNRLTSWVAPLIFIAALLIILIALAGLLS